MTAIEEEDGVCSRCGLRRLAYPVYHPTGVCGVPLLANGGVDPTKIARSSPVSWTPTGDLDKLGSAVEVNAAGGKQSKLQTRYDLFPPHAWAIVAEVLAQGALKYDEWNWLKIPAASHLNHALTHIAEYLKEEQVGAIPKEGHTVHEDHMAHAACRIMMALEMLVREGKR